MVIVIAIVIDCHWVDGGYLAFFFLVSGLVRNRSGRVCLALYWVARCQVRLVCTGVDRVIFDAKHGWCFFFG